MIMTFKNTDATREAMETCIQKMDNYIHFLKLLRYAKFKMTSNFRPRWRHGNHSIGNSQFSDENVNLKFQKWSFQKLWVFKVLAHFAIVKFDIKYQNNVLSGL